jgi:diadenylate cyclase
MFESILCQVTEYDRDVLESLIGLAVEIARESREGRRVGTLFTLGDENAVLARSRALILDPLLGLRDMSPISISAEPLRNWRSWTVGSW